MFEYDSTLEHGQKTAAEELEIFIALKAEEADLKERMDAQKDKVREILLYENGDKIENFKGFDFSVQQRMGYTYSENVKQMAEELKALKKLEEAQKIAKLSRGSVFPVMKKTRTPELA